MSKTKAKNKKTYYILIGIFVSCFLLLFFYKDRLINLKDAYTITTSISYDFLPNDELITDYDSYKKFIKSNLSENEYKNELSSDKIKSNSFDKYDYVAVFYESKMCFNDIYLKKLKMYKDKLIINIIKYEDEKCDLETRIIFIPVDKGYYEDVPKVIIQKKII